MVPKNGGADWHPCGDFRALNAITKPDKYPVSHIQDFSSGLHGPAVFSKIDLRRISKYPSNLKIILRQPLLRLLVFLNLLACPLAYEMRVRNFNASSMKFFEDWIFAVPMSTIFW